MAERSRRQLKKNQDLERILCLEKERARLRMVRKILKKPCESRTAEEAQILLDAPHLVSQIEGNSVRLKCLKDRAQEIIDEEDILSTKCAELAKAMKESSYTVVYTGAGISTSADIPDYRGPDGVWTLLQKGKEITLTDLSTAEPTFTHMALKKLHKERIIHHIVSQNCDGLHVRSGLPKSALSELHGNMFIEVCPKCKPLKQYVRLFDVTEKTSLHRHKTGRFCRKCSSELNDTIVHFGEKGALPWPMNWKGAVKAVEKADLIICLGTSLKVLRRYPGLWRTDQPHNKRPKLYIVNLQWTPKDTQATLKIHGKCDEVMKKVMSVFGICVPAYEKEKDPIFQIATPLLLDEVSTTTKLLLTKSETDKKEIPSISSDSLESPEQAENKLKAGLENLSTSRDLGDYLKSKPDLQPCVRLLDITSAESLIKLNAEKLDAITYFIKSEVEKQIERPKLVGWYGKGCAKWKKNGRKRASSCKRQKTEVVDSSTS